MMEFFEVFVDFLEEFFAVGVEKGGLFMGAIEFGSGLDGADVVFEGGVLDFLFGDGGVGFYFGCHGRERGFRFDRSGNQSQWMWRVGASNGLVASVGLGLPLIDLPSG